VSTKKRLTPLIFLCWLGGGWLVSHLFYPVLFGLFLVLNESFDKVLIIFLAGWFFPEAMDRASLFGKGLGASPRARIIAQFSLASLMIAVQAYFFLCIAAHGIFVDLTVTLALRLLLFGAWLAYVVFLAIYLARYFKRSTGKAVP